MANYTNQLTRIAVALEKLAPYVEEIKDVETQMLDELRRIRVHYLGVPVGMKLKFEGGLLGMPGTETDVQTIPCSAIETDADNQPVTLNPANVTWSIDDPTVATLTQNSDGSATFKALKVGTANVSCTDTGVTPPVVGTDTLTVTAGPASTLVLQFGTPA